MNSSIPKKHRLSSPIKAVTELSDNCLPKNLLCFSHLRWDFVYQRPQHLMSRFATIASIYFFEEPIFTESEKSFLVVSKRVDSLWVCVPHLPHGLNQQQINIELAELLEFSLLAVIAPNLFFGIIPQWRSHSQNIWLLV